jgi:ubiquinone/menaquinone biosynthesis C-methylase UbiE
LSNNAYVHGYSEVEASRLTDQANTLAHLLHHDTLFPPGHKILEAGCGVGAQTVLLASQNPNCPITSIDVSPESLAQAEARVREGGFANVTFRQADIFNLPFPPGCFDHLFVCFVLEHLADPTGALAHLAKVLKPGGTVTVIEGDHGSAYFHPRSEYAMRAIDCLVRRQADLGGDSLIGRRLYPLLDAAGYRDVVVSPRMVYVDASRPQLVEGFTKNTFTAMVAGVRSQALAHGLIDAADFDRGIRDLYRTTEPDGVFCYTFFKAVGKR